MPYQPPGYDGYGQVPYDPHMDEAKDGADYYGNNGATPLAQGRTNPFAPPAGGGGPQRMSSYGHDGAQQYPSGGQEQYYGEHHQQQQQQQYGEHDRYADAGGYDPDQTPRPDQYGAQHEQQHQQGQYYPPQQGAEHGQQQHYR